MTLASKKCVVSTAEASVLHLQTLGPKQQLPPSISLLSFAAEFMAVSERGHSRKQQPWPPILIVFEIPALIDSRCTWRWDSKPRPPFLKHLQLEHSNRLSEILLYPKRKSLASYHELICCVATYSMQKGVVESVWRYWKSTCRIVETSHCCLLKRKKKSESERVKKENWADRLCYLGTDNLSKQASESPRWFGNYDQGLPAGVRFCPQWEVWGGPTLPVRQTMS